MKIFLKYLVRIFLPLAILLVAALIILSQVQHESVRKKVADYLDRQFKGQVTFEDFSLSYLKSFPRIHLKLTGISAIENNEEIIHIGELGVILNVRDVLDKKVVIEKLVVRDAKMHSAVDSLGNRSKLLNPEKKQDDTVQSAFRVDIRKIEINDSKFIFSNQVKNNLVSVQVESGKLKIEKMDSLVVVSGSLEGLLDSLMSNGNVLFRAQPIALDDLELDINRINGIKELRAGSITAHSLVLEPKLKLTPADNGNIIDLRITGENKFDEILNLFEFHLGIDLAQVNPEARLKITYSQNGYVNPFKKPYSELLFEVSQAVFEGEVLPFPITLDTLSGNYNNGASHSHETVELNIDTIQASVNESFLHGHFKLVNLDDPFIDAHIESTLKLEHIFKSDKNFRIAGMIGLKLDIDGKINELKKINLKGEQHAKAEIKMVNLELFLHEKEFAIELVNGTSFLNNHILEIKTLAGEFNKSAFHFKGHFENLDQFILEKNQDLVGRFNIDFNELDLTKLNLSAETDEPDSKGAFMPFSQVALDIGIKGKKIITGFGTIENVNAKCRLEDDLLNISSISLEYQKGKIEGSGNLSFGDKGLRTLDARIDGHFGKLDLGFLEPSGKSGPEEKKPMKLPDHLLIKMNLQAGMIIYKDASLTDFHTGISLTENRMEINNLGFNLPFGSLAANVIIDGYPEKSRRFTGSASMEIDSVDVESIMALQALAVIIAPSKSSEKERSSMRRLPENIKFTAVINARRIIYQGLKFNDLALSVNYTDEIIALKKLNLGFAGGKLEMDGELQRNASSQSPGHLYLKTDSIDLRKLLESFDNFGQSSFTAENSSGKISSTSHHYFELNKDLTIKKSGNFWLGNIIVHSAEFDRVDPIENTLSFVGHKSRDTMYVSELNLNMLLADDKLYVRDLIMNDNIANLALSGEVDVSERELDMFIEVSLTDLMFKSKKKRLAETRDGVFTLEEDARVFLNLSGPLSKPKPKVINNKKFDQGREDLFGTITDAQKEFRDNRVAGD